MLFKTKNLSCYISAIQSLLINKANFAGIALDNKGNTVIHEAAKHSSEILNLLITYGADINCENNDKETALTLLFKKDLLDVITITNLLNKGADPNTKAIAPNSTPCLHIAINAERVELVELLLEKGASIFSKIDKITPAVAASRFLVRNYRNLDKLKKAQEIMHLLVKAAIKQNNVDDKADFGWALLHITFSDLQNNISPEIYDDIIYNIIVKTKPSLDIFFSSTATNNYQMQSMLSRAIHANNQSLTVLLILYGAQFNKTDQVELKAIGPIDFVKPPNLPQSTNRVILI